MTIGRDENGPVDGHPAIPTRHEPTADVAPSLAAHTAAVAVIEQPPRRRISLLVAVIAVVAIALIAAAGLLESASAIGIGVGASAAYFITVNKLIDLLPERTQDLVRPWAFVGPVLLVLFALLVVPAARTIYLSLFDSTGDFAGLDNYSNLFSDDGMRTVLRNNVLWIVGVTTFSTLFGLLMAVLADRVKHESLAKALVFLPMAISFVGASVIWRFIYDASRLADEDQVGLLNAMWVALGNDPVFWLLETPWNNFLLMVVMIWMQTGFAMVVLSSAIKGVPTELLEAARMDGANEWKVFRHVTLPSIAGTVAVVVTTTIILVLKVFDIVRVMTGGRDETSVIANEMIDAIGHGLYEQAGALAVLLFVAVIPVLIYNVRRFRRDEAMR